MLQGPNVQMKPVLMHKAQSGIKPQNKPSVLSSSCLPPCRSSPPVHAPAGKDGSPRKGERQSAPGVKHQLSTGAEITPGGMWCVPQQEQLHPYGRKEVCRTSQSLISTRAHSRNHSRAPGTASTAFPAPCPTSLPIDHTRHTPGTGSQHSHAHRAAVLCDHTTVGRGPKVSPQGSWPPLSPLSG